MADGRIIRHHCMTRKPSPVMARIEVRHFKTAVPVLSPLGEKKYIPAILTELLWNSGTEILSSAWNPLFWLFKSDLNNVYLNTAVIIIVFNFDITFNFSWCEINLFSKHLSYFFSSSATDFFKFIICTSFGIFSFFNHLHGVAVQPQTLICSYFKSQQSHLVAFSNNFTFIKSIEGDILS